FLDISSKVISGGEQGLLSVAFDPDFETNGNFYVYYTQNAPSPQPDGNVIIARYHATSPDVGDPASETILVTVPHTSAGNHNGGNVNFGPDGFLYAATGDGGFGGDPFDNAQNDASMLGKLLRIDPATGATTNWAKGLRNPFRFSFDRANGDIYIGDVGQGSWEEVDYGAGNPAGVNYGWDDMEGRHCFEPTSGCLTAGRTLPVLEYCNSAFSDPACSTFQPEKGQAVTGGFVYRGCRMPDLRGRYFYSDFYTAFIRSFMGVSGGNAQDLQNHTAALDPPGSAQINNVSSFGEDARGEIYIADYDGEIFKIVPGP
ncbi:MAG TPA: PQQ-dependent sugar dehydrogenase, partial [Candidatus Binatus sp.]|nr:PQQ-dependent sugar dehydrogenase [Candidatus Binatus sp.]